MRGRFVEAKQPIGAETIGFYLEDVTVVEVDPEEASSPDVEGTTVDLDMPLTVAGEQHRVGKEVIVEGRFSASPEEESDRVFVVKHIKES